MRIFLTGRVFRAVPGVLAILVALGCGGSDGEETVDVPATGRDDAFTVEPADSGQLVYGHGLALEVPAGWSEWGPEKEDALGRAYEWAIQAPEGDGAFLPHVAVSAGAKDVPEGQFEAAPDMLTDIQSLGENFEVIDEGEVDISGAERAYRMHVRGEQMATPPGGGEAQLAQVETYIVFLDMPGGQITTVRFHAPAGEFDDSALLDIYDSLQVVEETESV